MRKNVRKNPATAPSTVPDEGASAEAEGATKHDREIGEAPRMTSSPEDRRWRQLAVACLGLLALLNGALAVYAFSSLAELRRSVSFTLSRSEQRYQALDAQIRFDSRRRQLLLGMRDAIVAANPSVGWSDAYRYAALAMSASERYASIDPVLLVSLGIVQSGYDPDSRSIGGARGLYHLHPSTARLLSRALGWEYSDQLLFDPAKNTELATLYLETLFASDSDPRLVIAEYREGALRAEYLRSERAELDGEGARFVNDVLDTYERLVARYGTLRGLDEHLLRSPRAEPVPTSISPDSVDLPDSTGSPPIRTHRSTGGK